jgi:hypothetical protein
VHNPRDECGSTLTSCKHACEFTSPSSQQKQGLPTPNGRNSSFLFGAFPSFINTHKDARTAQAPIPRVHDLKSNMDDSTHSDPHQRHACEELAIRLTNPQNLLTQAKQLLDLAKFMNEHNITFHSMMAEALRPISVDASAPSIEDCAKRTGFNINAMMAMGTIRMIKSYANDVEAFEFFKDHDSAEMDTIREVLRSSPLTSEEWEEIVARSMSDGKRLLQLLNSHRGFLGLLPKEEWFCGKMLSSDEDEDEDEDDYSRS